MRPQAPEVPGLEAAAVPRLRPRRLVLLGVLVLAVAGIATAAALGPAWARAYAPEWTFARLARASLAGLEVVLSLLPFAALCGALGSGVILLRQRRARRNLRAPAGGFSSRSNRAARWLLASVACLVSFALAEAAAAVWLAWAHRMPSLTQGDAPPQPRLQPAQGGPPAVGAPVHIAVLGESSAVGFPFQQWLNVGEIVAWQLRGVLPGREVAVDLVAKPGDTLEGQHQKLADLRQRPDVLIVYCGHNEFAAHTPTSRAVDHYLDERRGSGGELSRWSEALAQISPVHRLIHETAGTFGAGVAPTPIDRRALVDSPSYTPAELAAQRAQFRARLEAIVAYAETAGAVPVLVAPPGNDAGYEPNRSFLKPETTRAQRAKFARRFEQVRAGEQADPQAAIASYKQMLEAQPGFAEAHFRLARLLEQTGAWDEAYEHYVAARDADGRPIRCLGAFQEAYREIAAQHRCILVDGQALFHKVGRHGLLDDSLFNDAMHPSLAGHIALAQAILDALHERRALGWPQSTPAPQIDPAACAQHFRIDNDAWKNVCEQAAMFYYGTAALRYDQTERRAKQQASRAAAQRIAEGIAPASVGRPGIGVNRATAK